MTIWAAVISIIMGLVTNELFEVSPWCARRLVRLAVRLRYTDLERRRLRTDELIALIDERPGNLFKLGTSLGFLIAAVPIWALHADLGISLSGTLTLTTVDGSSATIVLPRLPTMTRSLEPLLGIRGQVTVRRSPMRKQMYVRVRLDDRSPTFSSMLRMAGRIMIAGLDVICDNKTFAAGSIRSS